MVSVGTVLLPKMVLRKLTSCVVSLERKPMQLYLPRFSSVADQSLLKTLGWFLSVLSPQECWVTSPSKGSLPAQGPPQSAEGKYQPVLQGWWTGGNYEGHGIPQIPEASGWFYKYKRFYPYPQKEMEELESLLGHWWATEMDSLWGYHSNFSDGGWQRNYKVANVSSPSTVHSEWPRWRRNSLPLWWCQAKSPMGVSITKKQKVMDAQGMKEVLEEAVTRDKMRQK